MLTLTSNQTTGTPALEPTIVLPICHMPLHSRSNCPFLTSLVSSSEPGEHSPNHPPPTLRLRPLIHFWIYGRKCRRPTQHGDCALSRPFAPSTRIRVVNRWCHRRETCTRYTCRHLRSCFLSLHKRHSARASPSHPSAPATSSCSVSGQHDVLANASSLACSCEDSLTADHGVRNGRGAVAFG